MSIGSSGVYHKVGNMVKYPVRECLVQLYPITNFCMWSFHLLLWSPGNVCSIEILVWFMCSTFPLFFWGVGGWGVEGGVGGGMVLFLSSLANFLKILFSNSLNWSCKIFSGKPNLSMKS